MKHNRVTITDGQLVVEPLGLDKLWSFTGRLRFDLRDVRGATYDPGVREEPKGWRGPGLGLPGKLAGTFHSGGTRQFWNIQGYEHVIVITLVPGHRYDRLYLTVDDPDAVVQAINSAIG